MRSIEGEGEKGWEKQLLFLVLLIFVVVVVVLCVCGGRGWGGSCAKVKEQGAHSSLTFTS